jgi:hypothetical protein
VTPAAPRDGGTDRLIRPPKRARRRVQPISVEESRRPTSLARRPATMRIVNVRLREPAVSVRRSPAMSHVVSRASGGASLLVHGKRQCPASARRTSAPGSAGEEFPATDEDAVASAGLPSIQHLVMPARRTAASRKAVLGFATSPAMRRSTSGLWMRRFASCARIFVCADGLLSIFARTSGRSGSSQSFRIASPKVCGFEHATRAHVKTAE